MDYKDFIEAARVRQQQDDDEKRRRIFQQAAARRSAPSNTRQSSDNNDDGRSLLDRIGSALGAAANFGKESFIDPIVDAASGAKEGLEHVIEDATGATDERNRKFEESQNQWQDMLIKQLQKSKDETLSEEERAHARDSAASISRNMNQEFEQHQAGLQETIDESDPMKQAGNMLTLTTPAIGGLRLAKTAGQVAAPAATTLAGKAAQALTGNAAKTIAADTAVGALGGIADPLREKGSEATAGDILGGAGMGAALGGAISGLGEGAAALKGRDADVKQFSEIGRGVGRGTDAATTGAGRPVGASSTEMASTPTSPTRTAPDESDPFNLAGIDAEDGASSIDNRVFKPSVNDAGQEVPASEKGWFYNREQRIEDTKPKLGILDKINTSLFTEKGMLKRIDDSYENQTGAPLSAERSPFKLSQLKIGAEEAAKQRLEPVLASLDQATKEGMSDTFREYGVAKQILADRTEDYPPELVQQAQRKLSNIESSLSPEQLAELDSRAQAIVDFNDEGLRRAVDEGAMSEEWYNNIKSKNSYYFTPFNIEEYVNGNQRSFASSNSANNSKNAFRGRKGLDDAERFSIEDPFTAIANNAIKIENWLADNRVVTALRNLNEEFGDEVSIRLNDAESINKKINLQIENKDMRGVRDRLDKTVKRYGRDARRLETKINQLNKEGLQLSLKNGADRMETTPFAPGGLGGDVPTSRAGELVKGSENEFNSLLDEAAAISKKNPGTQRAADVKEFTTISGAGTRAETNPSQLGPQDTGNFVRNLIENGSRADIDRIKAKISKSDQRLHNMLDEIGLAKSEYDEVAGKINANNAEVSDIVAQGKDVPKGYEVLESWENGRKVRTAAPQWIVDSVKGKNQQQSNEVQKWIGFGSKTFRKLVTVLSPAFVPVDAARNMATSIQTSTTLSEAQKAAFLPAAKEWVQALFEMGDYKDVARTVRMAGGGGSNTLAAGKGEIAKHITENLGGIKPVENTNAMFKMADAVLKYPKRLFNAYEDRMIALNRRLEYAGKTAEAKRVLDAGGSAQDAAFAARKIGGDMQAGGELSKVLNAYIPFTNSILQGNKAVFDYAKKNPGRAAVTATTTIAIPTTIGFAWNTTMFPEVYDSIPDYEKENYFIIIMDDEKGDDGKWKNVIKIPKNEAAKLVGNPIEATLNSVRTEQPLAIDELFLKSIGYATPIQVERDGKFDLGAVANSTVSALPAAKVIGQLGTNKDFYTGQDITPDSLQGLNPEDQVRPSTTGLDKALSKATGGVLNPLEAESVRKTFTGSTFSKNPVESTAGRFVGASSSAGTNQFYSIAKDVQEDRAKANRAINNAIEAEDYEAAQQIAQAYNAKMGQTFRPWVERYGEDSDDSLREKYMELRLSVNSRSIKQRQRNLRERADKEAAKQQNR